MRSRLRDLLRRRRLDVELDEEIRFHLEREIEAHRAAGPSAVEARRRAHADFGAVAAIREEAREVRATRLLEAVGQDLRLAGRSMVRNPLFSFTAVATLALTIAAVGTLLTLTYAFLLQPLPVREPYRVVEVLATRNNGTAPGFVSYADYTALRDGTETLQGLAAAYVSAPLFVSGAEEAKILSGAVVTANFFALMGLQPAAGRFFDATEDTVPGRDAVIVLAHDFFRTRYASAEEAIGERLVLNGVSFTIVGVAPPEFHGIGTRPPQVYMPSMMLPVGYRWCSVLNDPGCTVLRMFGRLADGVDVATARAEMATLVPERWRDAAPGDNSGVAVHGLRGAEPGEDTERFLALLAGVAWRCLPSAAPTSRGCWSRAPARGRESWRSAPRSELPARASFA